VKLGALLSRPSVWWIAAALAGAVLCVVATSNEVYTATSPTSLNYYQLLRKAYSVVAFAVVGYFVARARGAAGQPASPFAIGMMVGAYSGLIEILQYYLDPPPEGIPSNVLDVACGFVGGYLAALAARWKRRK
jgi:hypothetical protein